MKRLLTLLGLGFACLAARAQTDPAYPTSPAAASVVTAAEAFIDTDPGIGTATPVTLTAGIDITAAATVASSSLAPGIHKVFLRTRSASGDWSMTLSREFLVDFNPAYPATSAVTTNIVRAEYFVDADPGQGLGTPLAVAASNNITSLTVVINTASLPNGLHRLFVRTQNATGQWSVPEPREFAVTQDYTYPLAASQAQSPVVRAEYFVDTDPGYGQGVAIPLSTGTDVTGITASINTTGLPIGLHRVGLRTQDAAGRWTSTAVHELLITDDFAYPTAPAAAGPVIAAEYFVDTDPGFGQAAPIELAPGTDVSNVSLTINTAGLSQGMHTLYIRSRQNPWSVTAACSFGVSTPLSTSLTQFSAKKKWRQALLVWEVSAGESLHHFEVERSAEGNAWTSVGRVSAHGGHSYESTDDAPLAGGSYYRLKIVGDGGDIAYSGAQHLYFGTEASTIQLHPNPTQSRFFIDGLEADAQVEVWSMAGSLAARFVAAPGSEGYDVSELSAGTYLVRIATHGAEVATLHLVKQ